MLTNPFRQTSILYLTFSGKYYQGFRVFNLEFYNAGGKKVDSLAVLSGAASTQYADMVAPGNDYSGSGRCLPESVYKLGGLEDVGPGQSWGEGIGRYWVSIDAVDPQNSRSAFGIHDDANRTYSMGSLGCVCPFSEAGMRRIVAWMQQNAKPEYLICNLGVGYLEQAQILYPGFTGIAAKQRDGYRIAVQFIQERESYSGVAYPDPLTGGDPWTIGYGNTFYKDGSPVMSGDTIQLPDAIALQDFWLRKDWDRLSKTVPDWQKMSAGQHAALLSFRNNTGWDYGEAGFDTLNTALWEKNWVKAGQALLLYVNPGSNVEQGLRNRRNAELNLWNS
jgi:GH24 family phage-related lysozyme (muramidase)